ncbi:MAG: hypothetical protein VR67_09600 [Peptococcaceae bacterium BRH_c8a]|nr:MAG: hypothetical protein VR67_09600 [Peptococcaceae bacterium BRH_c8a]
MTDTDAARTKRTDTINSEHFRRTKADKLRTVDSGELQDVSAEDLQEMYHIDAKLNKDDQH